LRLELIVDTPERSLAVPPHGEAGGRSPVNDRRGTGHARDERSVSLTGSSSGSIRVFTMNHMPVVSSWT